MKPTEIQYPIIGQLPEEQAITDSMVAQIQDLIQIYAPIGTIPLSRVVETLGRGTYLVVHMSNNWSADPNVEEVIKAVAPGSVVKHGSGSREECQQVEVNGDPATSDDPNNVTEEEFFAATMCLVITEQKDIMVLRGPAFPQGTRFTI